MLQDKTQREPQTLACKPVFCRSNRACGIGPVGGWQHSNGSPAGTRQNMAFEEVKKNGTVVLAGLEFEADDNVSDGRS
ncbi:hypothetical protein Q7P37_008885 [Cladosporium fusiforme]